MSLLKDRWSQSSKPSRDDVGIDFLQRLPRQSVRRRGSQTLSTLPSLTADDMIGSTGKFRTAKPIWRGKHDSSIDVARANRPGKHLAADLAGVCRGRQVAADHD